MVRPAPATAAGHPQRPLGLPRCRRHRFHLRPARWAACPAGGPRPGDALPDDPGGQPGPGSGPPPQRRPACAHRRCGAASAARSARRAVRQLSGHAAPQRGAPGAGAGSGHQGDRAAAQRRAAAAARAPRLAGGDRPAGGSAQPGGPGLLRHPARARQRGDTAGGPAGSGSRHGHPSRAGEEPCCRRRPGRRQRGRGAGGGAGLAP